MYEKEEKKLMKAACYFARVYCLEVMRLVFDLEDIMSSPKHTKCKEPLAKKIMDELFKKSDSLHSACCQISGRDCIKIPYYRNSEELIAAFQKGEL